MERDMALTNAERAEASKARVAAERERKAIGGDIFSWRPPSWLAGTVVLGLLLLIGLLICQWTGFLGL